MRLETDTPTLLRLSLSCIRAFFAALPVAVFAAVVPPAGKPVSLPNIVLILADDMGVGEVSALSPAHNRIPTPHIDRLATEGMVFTDAHSGSAVCTPTRYGLLTGRYAWRTRLQSSVLWGLSAPLIDRHRLTVGRLLQRKGYHTAAFGKWHLGMDWSGGPSDAIEVDDIKIDYTQRIANGPIERGFDRFFGISASLDMAPYLWIDQDRLVAPSLHRQTEWYRSGLAAQGFHAVDVLDELIRRSTEYVERKGESAKRPEQRPFFVYLPLTSPHTPIVPSSAWQGRSGLGAYGDFVLQTDAAVGAVLASLERAGIAENTIVIFTSDNGCSAGPAKAAELEKQGHFPSGPYRGAKSDLFEGGHRVPFLVRWPARVRAGSSSDRTLCLTDLLATCAELTGTSLREYEGEDSVSFLPTLLGLPQPARTAVVHHSISGHFAIREGSWKLLLARGSGGWSAPTEAQAEKQNLPAVQLYDLKADPGERTNVAAAHPEIVARLSATLAQHAALGRSTPGPAIANDVAIDLWKSGHNPILPAPTGKHD